MEEYVNIILGDQVLTSDKKLLCSYSFFKHRFEFDVNTDINLDHYNNHDLIKKQIMFVKHFLLSILALQIKNKNKLFNDDIM
ncbi:kelch-like protein [Cowpox virus]|uniref:Kelch-like protein n=1 Tax=Cowpox virus TaxID=10243 RepID=G0XSA2_COWPX|nr:kelch-like protein [Cowpox virus]